MFKFVLQKIKYTVLIVLVLGVVFIPLNSLAAPVFDASSGGSVSATSLTYSHTVGSLTDGYIVVGVYAGNGSDRPVSSITYDGVNLSALKVARVNSWNIELWGLANPSSDANNVVINVSGGATTIQAASISVSGADPTQPGITSSGGNAVSTASGDLTVTTQFDNSLLVDIWGINTDFVMTEGANQTERREQTGNGVRAAMSTEVATSIGSFTMSYSTGSVTQWSGATVEIKEKQPEAGGVGRNRSGNRFVGTGISR